LIVLPKAEAAKDVAFVDTLLTQIETACSLPHRIAISPMIETAKGLQNVAEITAASPRLAALIFGSGDFAASMNMPLATIGGEDAYDEAYSGHRWHHVMQSLLTAARANGLRAIDGPYADFKDPSGLQRLSILGRGLGFDGKWCIHPAQLETVLKAYTPSDAEIASADRIVTAYHAAQTSGLGVISVDGKMVDAANLRMARQTLARAGRDTKDN